MGRRDLQQDYPYRHYYVTESRPKRCCSCKRIYRWCRIIGSCHISEIRISDGSDQFKGGRYFFLKSLGADKIVARNGFEDRSGKALLKPQFAAAIDTVGGNILATLIKSLHYEGVVTTCGMVGGGELNTSVFPFILKGIQLIGIDSVEIPWKKGFRSGSILLPIGNLGNLMIWHTI